MTKLFWNVFRLSPVVLAATFFAANSAFAGEATEKTTSVADLSEESNNIGQVTSVSQFTDVQPTDWAFQALQSLVERYGCIAGYPNSTFRGNRALTRYEFAAGLNACLDRINELIAIATEKVGSGDLETLKRLQEEYAAELATLRGRVDGLEFRTAELEANQISTTTKLKGEVVIAASGAFGDSVNDDNVILSNRARLNFDSSFTGKDKLRVRLQARNTPKFSSTTGTNMARLGFDGDNKNNFELTELNYAFKPIKGVKVKIDANEADLNDNINVFNPVFKSSGGGAISRYGRFSPIYRTASNQAGATITFGGKKSPIKLSAAYTAGTDDSFVSQTGSNNGLFDGNNAVLGQIDFKPVKALNLGFTYVRRYDDGTENNLSGSTGSSLAKKPFGNDRTTSNNYGVQASLRLNKKTTLSGWYGFSDAENATNGTDDAEIQYWAATLGFKDFGAKGNTLGVIFGQPPKVTDNSVAANEDEDTSYHLEGLYKMKVNDNIAITPGLLVIFNPEHEDANDTVYVGTLRTTFKF
ncbi:MAG: iron uptake porin [Rivularia sp. (in: cyanobacteria)]